MDTVMESTGKDKEKPGVVPAEEISGSDADKAYDKEGGFNGESAQKTESNSPKGADADSNE
jgi:hypothetical protein